MQKTVVVLGASADIGSRICYLYAKDGFRVIGTYRKTSKNIKDIARLKSVHLLKCDVTRNRDIEKLSGYFKKTGILWTTLFSSIGTTEPIGPFFNSSFDKWENSIKVNCVGQLRIIHALYCYKTKDAVSNVALLAGGGTNTPFRNYSAYCVSKIMLIKMCELLDDENSDLNIFIVGPGFVRTKTHLETIKAGKKAGRNYDRVKRFLDSNEPGTSFIDIYKGIRWLERQGREVSGGRNFSIMNDKLGSDRLSEELKKDLNMYKLRRYRNEWK